MRWHSSGGPTRLQRGSPCGRPDDPACCCSSAASRRLAPLAEPEVPVLDEDGLLHSGGRWVSLPPVEARLAKAMLDRYSAVVSRDALARAGWPQGAPGRNALDVHVLRLRRRIAELGLEVRTVRSRGYLMQGVAQNAVAAR